MEIKILHHPSDETAARKISEVLNDDGISSQLTNSAPASKGVHITVSKPSESKKEASLLASSFVHLDTKPGY